MRVPAVLCKIDVYMYRCTVGPITTVKNNTVQADGTVRFEHLGDGPFTLRVWANPFSPARLTGLRAGRQPVVVQLKRQDGLSRRNLHGQGITSAVACQLRCASFLAMEVVTGKAFPSQPPSKAQKPRPCSGANHTKLTPLGLLICNPAKF